MQRFATTRRALPELRTILGPTRLPVTERQPRQIGSAVPDFPGSRQPPENATVSATPEPGPHDDARLSLDATPGQAQLADGQLEQLGEFVNHRFSF
jgi:hypothetical protein